MSHLIATVLSVPELGCSILAGRSPYSGSSLTQVMCSAARHSKTAGLPKETTAPWVFFREILVPKVAVAQKVFKWVKLRPGSPWNRKESV